MSNLLVIPKPVTRPSHSIRGGVRRAASLLALATLTGAWGCVSQTRYEELQSAAEVEREGHRRARVRLQELEQELARLEAELGQRERAIAEREAELSDKEALVAQAELDANTSIKERDAAKELVAQLRGELARVGDHLRVFGEQKQELATALESAEERAQRLVELEQRVATLGHMMRDLALALHEPVSSGRLRLDVSGTELRLRAAEDALIDAGGKSLTPLGNHVAAALGRIAKAYPDSSFRIRATRSASAERLSALSNALGRAGAPSARVTVEVADADVAAGASEGAREQPLEIVVGVVAAAATAPGG